MLKKIVPIRGMHCRACEGLIGEQLRELPQVKTVKVSVAKREAEITYNGQLDMALVERAVEEAGYSVGREELPWLTSDLRQYDEFALAAGILVVLWLVLRNTGLINFDIGLAGKPTNLMVVLAVGLMAGFSTCMALVGGLVLAISAGHAARHPEATYRQKFRPHIFFNLGRIATYFILGGGLGLAGKVFQLSGTMVGTITIIAGLVMLLLGVQLTKISPKLSHLSMTLPTGLGRFLRLEKRHVREYSHRNALMVGGLTFFLPCGFTQAMQLYAVSTGNFWSGALIMGVFAIGTAPGLLGVGGLTAGLKGAWAARCFKFTGVVVMGLALFNIANGMNLTGLTSMLSASARVAGQPAEKQADGGDQASVQILRMDQLANGYRPNSFTVEAGVPVKWIITSRNPNSCAGSLYVRKLNIRRNLKAGENVIEFTPAEPGRIAFSCAMGMYAGWIDVIDGSGGRKTILGGDRREAETRGKTGGDKLQGEAQVISATYTAQSDISPKQFNVMAGRPVRFEINARDDGRGCMRSVMLPGLVDNFEVLERDKLIAFNFTPSKPGVYPITCVMGAKRGEIVVN